MTAPFRIRAGEIEFPCNGDETVLDAAERAGYAIPYSCRKGVCSTCEAKLVEGSATCGADRHTGPQEGLRLCRAIPASDLIIAPSRIEARELFPRKRLAARVFKLLRPTPDVALIHLRFAAGSRIKFRAGQYLRVLFEDGGSRSFSMANPPHENDGVHLHVGRVPGGRFSEQVLASLHVGDRLEVEAPFGDFFLREEADGPIAFLATGTGFAPIKAMIDDMIKRSCARSTRLYWGVRHKSDFYVPEVFEKWRRTAPWLQCVPVLSRPDGDWSGRRGFVQDALLEDCRDLSNWQVYACGNPAMVAAAKRDLTGNAGLPALQFHADPFVPSGD